MKKLLITFISVSAASSSSASWLWTDTGGATPLGSGSSGEFERTAINTDYDSSNDFTDDLGFDQAPTATSFSWDSGSEPIGITLSADGIYFVFDLDFDNDNVLPTSVTFDVRYSLGISDRGIAGGGLSGSLNPLSSTLDFQMTTLDVNLNPLALSSDNNFRTGSSSAATPSFSPEGSALFNNYSLDANFAGLTNGGFNASTAFPRDSTDPTQAIGGLDLVFSDYGTGEEFRLSFDGGVSANALTVIPEPSVSLLGSLAFFALLRRRRKS